MPDQARVVVVNTTPIVALALIHQLDLLYRLYGNVIIPPAVQSEVIAGGTDAVGAVDMQKSSWIQVRPLQDPRRADLLTDLDHGEAEAIALAQELHADLLIIDERLARRHAELLGLKLTGTIGVLLQAKQRGFVPAVGPLIERPVQNGIWLSTAIINEALKLAKES